MRKDIIQKRLESYDIKTVEDEQDALKEILQEIILYGLANTDFFRKAAFHGGTSLRILHDLPRFSEDLDFVLQAPDSQYQWKAYLDTIAQTCEQFGVVPDIVDKSRENSTVQKMFLKDDSIGKVLNLSFYHHPEKKAKIKLEIDINPPAGANIETRFLSFPLDCSITIQNLPSNFAGKCHALLCSKYLKGIDWYDFIWYVNNRVTPNLTLLTNALQQQGPWANQDISVSNQWLQKALEERINVIDWDAAREDVMPFLAAPEMHTTQLWGVDFFLSKLEALNCTLGSNDAILQR